MTVFDKAQLVCDDGERRAKLEAHAEINGIDYIEVPVTSLDDQRFLDVHFLNATHLADLADHAEQFSVDGGIRVQNVKVIDIVQEDDHLVVEVDRVGDFSIYSLTINSEHIDPAFSKCAFSFKAGCPSRLDCKPAEAETPSKMAEPLIDYMAKDYASFRQALLDLAAQRIPDWKERHEADLGIALAELLSYVGDHLSYYQDAVANEAYLETSRQRVSVRRHARLIDYQMHDGASARTFTHLTVETPGTLPAGTQLLTRIDVPLVGSQLPGTVIESHLQSQAIAAADVVFETMEEASFAIPANEIEIYTWSNRECCLALGAVSADLVGDLTTLLKPGDYLLFEEICSPQTGLEADADPVHRQIVRLTDVRPFFDPVDEVVLTSIQWDREDSLRFSLCLAAIVDGLPKNNLSVARGNLVLADHGCRVQQWSFDGSAGGLSPSVENGERATRFRLTEGPLSFRVPLPAELRSVSQLMQADDPAERGAQLAVDVRTKAGTVTSWKARPHLFDSDPWDRHFAWETDNKGRGIIRFGDGEQGMTPPDGSHVAVSFRVGVGALGNVGAESLGHVIEASVCDGWPGITELRNPLSAWGGVDPEPLEHVKQLAPAAFHTGRSPVVTEEDYARVAEQHPLVSHARATFRWTGSWHTVFVSVDPVGHSELPAELAEQLHVLVARRKLAGYDLEIRPPVYVPLDIEIDVCVEEDHFRAHVEEVLLRVLGAGMRPCGRRGLFHPDEFTFGEPLYLSRLYDAIESVEGVESAVVTKFQRFAEATRAELSEGLIPMERLEVLRLDNDPSSPEQGVLRLNMGGGR